MWCDNKLISFSKKLFCLSLRGYPQQSICRSAGFRWREHSSDKLSFVNDIELPSPSSIVSRNHTFVEIPRINSNCEPPPVTPNQLASTTSTRGDLAFTPREFSLTHNVLDDSLAPGSSGFTDDLGSFQEYWFGISNYNQLPNLLPLRPRFSRLLCHNISTTSSTFPPQIADLPVAEIQYKRREPDLRRELRHPWKYNECTDHFIRTGAWS